MGGPNGAVGYLFLVSVGDETTTMNRPQLLGSMPKILDGLSAGETVVVRLIDQHRFAELVRQMLEDDVGIG
jgi:hypothetical protein